MPVGQQRDVGVIHRVPAFVGVRELGVEVVRERSKGRAKHRRRRRCTLGRLATRSQQDESERRGHHQPPTPRASPRPHSLEAIANTQSAAAITRVTESPTKQGLSPPSTSIVKRVMTSYQLPPLSSTETTSALARILEST